MPKKAKTGRADFEIFEHRIAAGSRHSFDLPVPDLYVHNDLAIPIHVIHGRRDGPVLFVSAAVHGDEILGVEIIRRLLASKQLSRLRGTLVAAPVVNIFGFLNQSRYLPDRRDLNRSFPGSEGGSIAARLANLFLTQIISRCTHGVDLHTAAINRENLPQIRADTLDPEVEAMAKAFGLPVIINSELIEGSIREAAADVGVKMVVYEAGEALRFDETAIRAGVNGVMRVMRHLGMLLPARISTAKKLKTPTVSSKSRWVRAPQSGIHRSITPLGAVVHKGDAMGFIASPLDVEDSPVLATTSGVVIGRSNIPLVTEGEALFHVASFDLPDDVVAERIDAVEEVLDQVVNASDLQEEPPIV
ncbi:MAG: succinylglutamate desuccinylase/aspartoacylase family protein [Gammaproteobacteria bacterium]|jgi:predicted deacylase